MIDPAAVRRFAAAMIGDVIAVLDAPHPNPGIRQEHLRWRDWYRGVVRDSLWLFSELSEVWFELVGIDRVEALKDLHAAGLLRDPWEEVPAHIRDQLEGRPQVHEDAAVDAAVVSILADLGAGGPTGDVETPADPVGRAQARAIRERAWAAIRMGEDR